MHRAAAVADIRDRVRRFVRDAFLVDHFRDDESFLAGGIVDSLGMMQLVAFLESEFGVRADEHEVVPENFDSVERVARFVARKLASGERAQDVAAGASPT
jgi:acyl carrier protein